MERLYNSQLRQVSGSCRGRRVRQTLCGVALSAVFSSLCLASPPDPAPADPMHGDYSESVRKEYAKCRQGENMTSAFFCACELLEAQCTGPRRPEHKGWNTVEFWPSDNEAEREVHFMLFVDYDFLGEFAPLNTAIVFTCMAGTSDLNVFLGQNVEQNIKPIVTTDHAEYQASFEDDDGDAILRFDDMPEAQAALMRGGAMSVSYMDTEENERNLEFNTSGFSHVTQGWESLCTGAAHLP